MAKGSGITAPKKPSAELAVILGSKDKVSRGGVMKGLWKYIKKHKLQSEDNGQIIECDENLRDFFGKGVKGKRSVEMRGRKVTLKDGEIHMTQMGKYVSDHLS